LNTFPDPIGPQLSSLSPCKDGEFDAKSSNPSPQDETAKLRHFLSKTCVQRMAALVHSIGCHVEAMAMKEKAKRHRYR
jgi:hypothetical protein